MYKIQLSIITANKKDPPIVLSADANVKHQAVIHLLDVLRQLDLVKITFATQILED